MIDIRTLRVEANLLNSLNSLRKEKIGIEIIIETFFNAENMISNYCDNSFPYEKELIRLLSNLRQALDDEVYLYWYDRGYIDDDEISENVPIEISKELQKMFEININNLEKFIIRGTEGGSPITEDERNIWWKEQKAREREEFYNENGYYEDELS